MKIFQNNYVKIFVYIVAVVAMIELSRLAFWLMNQPSSYAVYAGFITALALILALSKIFMTVFRKALNYFTNPEQE